MTFILTFITLSIINVIFSTIRSIVTVKGGRMVASLLNGFYFAFYNIMLIYTVADFPLWQKCLVTFSTNVIGVYIVKLIEEKMRKDRLWQINFTVNNLCENVNSIKQKLKTEEIPFNYQNLGKYTVFTCYSYNQKDSLSLKKIINEHNGKYFASETKIL